MGDVAVHTNAVHGIKTYTGEHRPVCKNKIAATDVATPLVEQLVHEVPPDRDNKVHVCALPGCNIDGKGVVCDLLRCSQCRNIHYCSVEHQKQHWKVLKQTCTTAIATASIPTSTTTDS